MTRESKAQQRHTEWASWGSVGGQGTWHRWGQRRGVGALAGGGAATEQRSHQKRGSQRWPCVTAVQNVKLYSF